MAGDGKPVLWHIPVSHYSEKVRWALDYKQVAHERKAPPPPAHMAIALAYTRGKHKTFPVMRLNGRHIGDSSEIIAALEERYPKPPLYPGDPAERARALELEDWFDEQLGPHARLLVFHEATEDRELFEKLAVKLSPPPLNRAPKLAAGTARTFVRTRFRVASKDSAELARRKVVEAFDRLDAELGEREYLVGERFSVADLGAAALLYPIVMPPEGPTIVTPDLMPQALKRFREPLEQRRGFRWVAEMFRRHRQP